MGEFGVQFFKNLNADAGKKAEYGALFDNKNMGPFGGNGRDPFAALGSSGG